MIKVQGGKCEMHGDGAKLIGEFFTVCRALTTIAAQGIERNKLNEDRAKWLKERLKADLLGCVGIAFSGINDSDEKMAERFEKMIMANVERFSTGDDDSTDELMEGGGNGEKNYC